MAKKIIRAYEPATIVVEPERRADDGSIEAPAETIEISVKRLTVQESATFDRLFWRGVSPEAERLVLVRRPGPEQDRASDVAITSARLEALRQEATTLEQTGASAWPLLTSLLSELIPTDQFVVPDEEIRRRRLVEMTDGERARYDRLRAEDAEAYGRFLSEALGQFVRVVPGQLAFEEDGEIRDVLDGEQLAKCYGARTNILQQIALAIRAINEMTDAQKNDWRSRSDSSISSTGRDRAETSRPVTGTSSAPTAAPVDRSDSATTVGATPTADSLSGATGN
jgi:hypothetical protein